MGQASQVGDRDVFGEPHDPVVAGMDAEQGGGLGSDRAGVIGESSLIGRPDFAEPGAGDLEDLGEAKTAADLDQLAARDDDLAPGRKGTEGDDRRGRRCC